MLQSIRDRSQGWLAGGIIAIICITFALWGVRSYVGDSASSAVVAKVNGVAIQQADFNAAYQRLRQQQQIQLGAAFIFDQKMEMLLKKEALNQLIMAQVLSQAATKAGYRITSAEVGAALLSLPVFQVNGQFSRDRFNDVLSSILYTENAFLNDLRITMLINQMRSGYLDSAFSLPNDVKTAIALVNQKRDFGYLIVPASRFLNHVTVSDTDAQAYYMQHQAQFILPEQVSIEYIELSLPQLASSLHFTDAQRMQYYQTNISNYTLPERWHVAHILVKVPQNATPQQLAAAKAKVAMIMNQIKAGKSFGQLARQYSDDTLSAKNDGMLDWFGPGVVDPAFEKAVAALQQIGQVSPPVQTKYGFSIIKLLGVQKSQVQPFAQVHDQVEKALAQQQAEQMFSDASDKLSNLTYTNPNTLDSAAKALGLEIKTSDLFSRAGGKDEITANPKVIEAVFSPDVLQGNNSNVIALDPDTLLVLRIKQHNTPQLQPFPVVKDQVIEMLKADSARQQAQAFGQQLLQQLQQSKNGVVVATKAGLTWNTVTNARRFDNRAPAALVNDAFRTPRPAIANAPTMAGFILPKGDYAVIMLNGVHDGAVDNTSMSMQQRIYGEEIANGFGQLDYTLYVQGVLSKAHIKIAAPITASTPVGNS
jgi:peptidyl-prolyl cis-trans isomerase D